jgi:hypothetical protein
MAKSDTNNTKARRRLQRKSMDQRDMALCSLDIVTGAQNLATLSPQDLFDRERPEDIRATFKLAREWHKQNWFVEQVNLLKAAFYNYGLRIAAADKAGRAKLKAWLDDPDQRESLLRYIDTVWDEWLLLDNVVSFWREEKEMTPYILLGETCTYSDAMGIEKLKVNLGYKKHQLEGADLSQEEVRRYTSQEITLSEDFDEFFRVLTRGARGSGFVVPRLYRVFRTLSQNESMEVGETMLAYAGRLVLRFHQLGFEVRSGSNSAKQAEYLWKKKRADAIEKFFKGRQGFAETTGQFDHKISYVWVDPKQYDGRKWETIVNRMLWWAGPLGFMMLAKSVSPFLLQMLKAQAEKDRRRVAAHLESVINAGFNIGAKVKLSWSNRCFYDSRLAWDMVKSLMQQGPLSLTSSLEEADFDPETEAERKRDEASAERDKELLPKFDANHGKRPAEIPGRKTGVPDGAAVK